MKIVPVSDIPRAIEPVPTNPVLYRVCCAMEALCEQENGVGLHAFQVGLPWNIFVIKCEDGRYESYIDCEYHPVGETKVVSLEGCLSLKDRQFKVERYEKVRIVGKQLERMQLKDIDKELTGLYSIVSQHEIDHSKNRLISDFGIETTLRS